MSSETITRTDLTNILNEVLPTPRYGGIYSATWTSSGHSAYNLRLTNYMNLPAGTYVVIVISPYVSTGTALICPRVNDTVDYKHLQSCPTGGISNGAFIVSLDATSTVAVYSEGSASVTYSNIERARLYAIQISDAQYNTNQADYIVEQGTDGGWTYRKWNSGIAEAWRRTGSHSYVMTNAVSGNGYASDYWTLPSGLFTSVTEAHVNRINGGNGLVSCSIYAVTTSRIDHYIWVTGTTATITMELSVEVKGTWK